jgi:hypothetical protein
MLLRIPRLSPDHTALRDSLAVLAAAAGDAVRETGAPEPRVLTVRTSQAAHTAGETRPTRSGFTIVLRLGPGGIADWRHVAAHELGHVALGAIAGYGNARGPASEYLAERIAWSLSRQAGWRPGADISIPDERANEAAWLPFLAETGRRMAADGAGAGSALSEEARDRLFRAGWAMTRAEVYTRAAEDALGVAIAAGRLPDALARGIAEIAQAVSRQDEPWRSAVALDEYLVFAGTHAEAVFRTFRSAVLPAWCLAEASC